MNRFLFAAALAAATTAALAGDNQGHASIGQPDYYGRLDFGDYPQPQVINRHPIAIGQVPTNRTPVYLRVPPGQAKSCRKHCREYNACGERVFFVQDTGTTASTFRVTRKFIVTAKMTGVTNTMMTATETRTIPAATITTMAVITRALA
jgi:hypothetical protein